MESFKRSSFEEAGLAASALRRWTRSPTGHRLAGLRRSATGSTSAASVRSLESDKGATTCVTRETSSDECALHRFIVWAAVKRNACARMTAEERRECPLLRCRKRFPNHELMLQHLYSCEHLASGEYWCYDCGKAEQLSDIKCRRCLGHPSKRKKMMSMARSFFGSLGHKSRNGSLPDLDLDMDEELTYYDSVLSSPKVELQANEIHEIDSCELPLPTIPEAGEEPSPDPDPEPFATYLSNLSSLPAVAPPRASPAELGPSHSGIDESLFNWEPSPTPPPAVSEALPPPETPGAAERPVLQLNIQGLGYYRARSRHRSKVLAPSSSVRSTASAASTNSTSSTASHNISPMSAWSGAWSKAPGFDSTLTSPADDLTGLADLFPRNDNAYRCREIQDHDMDLSGIAAGAFLPELPADVPMYLLPSANTLPGDVDLNQSSTLSFGVSVPTEQSMDANLALTGSLDVSQEPTQLVADIARNQQHVSAHSLIQTARNMLDVHVANSMTSLRRDGKNHLVKQFLNMSPNSVADAGLEVMMDILEGHLATSPVKLLCFVHVIYSLSVVVHEQDAPRRCTDLFIQAVSYSSWLSHQDRQAYIQVVDFLWKPSDMTDGDFMELLQTSSPQPERNSGSRTGKERADTLEGCRFDALAFVAQYFLDELEDSALHDSQRPEIQASDLCMEHLRDVNLEAYEGSPFSIAASNTIDSLLLQYGSIPGFQSAMSFVLGRVKSNYVATPRRLELELMQAGKMRLSSDVCFDEYIVFVRRHLDALYELYGSGTTGDNDNPRLRYYRHGIRLMRSIIQQPEPEQPTIPDASADVPFDPLGLNGRMPHNLDDLFGSMPAFDFDIPTDTAAPVPGTPIPDVSLNPPPPDEAAWLPTPEGTASMGASAGGTGTPASPAPSSSSKRVGSNSCCGICGYRPKGDPRWFGGSMAKHKKLQHGAGPPKLYKCPFPGCSSQYKSRPDNLRQHQIDKGHFVDGEDDTSQRPSKRKKTG
ncbi:hypothetical protein TOPH_07447 [Tolypocladium ophioglossoides CBS 100239]|uniref:C2H2-type domain-containing protein n=1 Tax=Tolypocladium ophioglossoides (strain CBS 100239) TaxID=1163406 RepID=A0A0L0N1C8_TOLOC|nr:hypothetical protein TOPH_07447 [Tolypocladium ophioglossoides CBS 100239]